MEEHPLTVWDNSANNSTHEWSTNIQRYQHRTQKGAYDSGEYFHHNIFSATSIYYYTAKPTNTTADNKKSIQSKDYSQTKTPDRSKRMGKAIPNTSAKWSKQWASTHFAKPIQSKAECTVG
jgi:hypothetical protein